MFMLPTAIVWVMLADLVTGPPLPTKEIAELIEKTGDDSFQVREKATRDLEKLGWKALRALEMATRNKDAEIAMRARRSLAKYYTVNSDDKDTPTPKIWLLDNELRWPKGKVGEDEDDLGKKFYELARNQYNSRNESQVSDKNWNEEWLAQEATRLYVKDLLWRGMDREKVRKRLNGMVENAKNMYNESNGNGEYDNANGQWHQGMPGKLVKQPQPEGDAQAGVTIRKIGTGVVNHAIKKMPRPPIKVPKIPRIMPHAKS